MLAGVVCGGHTQLVTGANFYQEVEVEDGGGDGEVGGTG